MGQLSRGFSVGHASRSPDPLQRLRSATRRAVEALESRLLLSSDFIYSGASSSSPLNALLTNTATNIELVDKTTSQVIASEPLATLGSGGVQITGTPLDDSLTVNLTIPLAYLTYNNGGGNDSFEFGGNLSTTGGDVIINAAAVTVDNNVVISTEEMLAGSSYGDSGAIDFTGTSITVNSGASLLASVSAGSAYSSGDIDLEASDAPTAAESIFGDLLSPVLYSDRNATITVGAAQINGDNVTLHSTAQTQTRWDDPGAYSDNISNQLLTTLTQVSKIAISLASPVSGQVKIEHSTGVITLTNTTINAAGTASVTADSSANSSFTTVGINSKVPLNNSTGTTAPFIANIGYGETLADADVELDGSTSILAKGDVTVGTDIDSEADVTSRGNANASLSDMDTVEVAVSLAVAVTDEVSTVSTSPQSRIESQTGDVNVTAGGTSNTTTSASALLFQDGIAGLAVGVSVDNATVTSTVNGTIIADNPQGQSSYSFNSAQVVSVANDSIELSGIDPSAPITLGQQLIYHADNGRPIGGLTDGDTYVVANVVTDSAAGSTLTQTIQLATAMPLTLDASQVDPTSTQTLGQEALSTFNSSAVTADSSNDLSINPAGLTSPLADGDTVTYLGPNSPVDEQNITGTFAPSASGDTITRTDGGTDWQTLGLFVGEQIQISNASGSNNGTFTVKGFTPDGLGLILTVANVLTAGTVSGFNLASTPATPTAIGNLTQGAQYVVSITGGKILLRDPSDPSNFIQYSNSGTGIQGFSYESQVFSFNPSTAVNSSTGTIDLPNSNLQTGDVLIYNTDPNNRVTRNVFGFLSSDPTTPIQIGTADLPDPPINGLQDGYAYYVTRVDADHIQLSESPVAARGAAVIDLTSTGTGTQDFTSADLGTGINVTATLTATNSGSAGAQLSDAEEPFSSVVLNAPTNAEDLIAGFTQAPNMLSALREAVDTRLGSMPFYGPQPQPAQDTGVPLDLSGTFAINVYQHDVQAIIGSTATLKSGKDINVTADVEETSSTASNSQATRNGQDSADTSNTGADRADIEISVGFAYTLNQNTAQATVQGNAVLDASGTTSVTSTVDYPFQAADANALFNPAETVQNSGLNGFGLFLDGTLGLASNLFNSYAVSLAGDPGSADSDKFVIGAAVDIELFTNISTATIGASAQINQDPTFQNVNQVVNVTSTTTMQTIDVGQIAAYNLGIPGLTDGIPAAVASGDITDGLSSLVNPFGVSGQTAIGPSVIVTVDNNTTTASIQSGEDLNANLAGIANNAITLGGALDLRTGTPVVYEPGTATPITGLTGGSTYYVIANPASPDSMELASSAANATAGIALNISSGAATGSQLFVARTMVHTGSAGTGVDVDAEQTVFNVAVSQTGGKSTDFGLTVSVTVGSYTSDTEAYIGTDVDVMAPAVTVNSVDTTDHYGIEGAYVLGQKVGIGASVGVNSLDRTTLAYIGSPTAGSVAANLPQMLSVPGTVTVSAANHGNVFALALAGSVLTDPNYMATPMQPTIPTNTSAMVGGVTIAVGASVATNEGTSDVNAFIEGVTVAASGVVVTATSDVVDRSIVVGGAVNATNGQTNVGIGGAFAISDLTSNVTANLTNSNITVDPGAGTPGVFITASDTSTIYSDGGGVALVLTRGAKNPTNISVGVGVAVNAIDGGVAAFIQNSPVISSGNIEVTASYGPTINAVTIAGAGAVSTGSTGNSLNIAGAGAGAKNQISGGASAYIANTTGGGDVGIISNGGSVIVQANDTSSITVDAGAFALALSLADTGDSFINLSFAVSVAINNITDTTAAYILDSSVRSDNNISVTANSYSTIKALTIGGAAASGAFSGAGSGNTINNTVQAYIKGGLQSGAYIAPVLAESAVYVQALDDETITADGGGFAIALTLSQSDQPAVTGSIGIGAAVNTITSSTTADIFDSNVYAFEGADVSAQSSPTISALTMGGAGAATVTQGDAFNFAGAGAGSGNSITAVVEASITDLDPTNGGTTVLIPDGDISVYALDDSTVTADAGAIALVLGIAQGSANINVSVGASAAVNNITDTATAVVNNATLSTGSAVNITAVNDSSINALTIAGAAALGIQPSGSSGFGLAFSGAGTGSGNTISANTTADIVGGAQVSANSLGSVTVTTTDDSSITADAIAGSLSVNAGSGAALGIGVAIAENTISGGVNAYVDGSTVKSYKSVVIYSSSDASIQAVTVGVAASVNVGSGDGVSLAGTGAAAQSTNKITRTIQAYIDDGSTVTTYTSGNIDITAVDTSTIGANSGGGSLAVSASPSGFSGALAVSAGLSTNTITNSILAFISGPKTVVTAAGAVDVNANSTSTITGFSISVGAAVALTDPEQGFGLALDGGASQANNTVTNTIAAYESNQAVVNAVGNISLQATDAATVTATVPSFQLSVSIGVGLAIGISLGNNTINDGVDAYTDGATANSSAGSVILSAISADTATATATPISVSISIGAAGQGGTASSTIGGHTQASVETGSNIIANAGAVDVSAVSTDVATSTGNGGGFGLIDIAALLVNADITASTTASVGSTANIHAGALDVLTKGVNPGDPTYTSDNATATLVVGSVGILGGAGGNDESSVTGPVTATISTGATVVVTGDVTVDAESNFSVNSNASGGSGGVLNVTALIDSATISGSTSSSIGDGANISAGTLNVTANATKSTTATVLAAVVTVVGAAGGGATATDESNTTASIGTVAIGGTPNINVTGATAVSSTSNETTTANAHGGAGGLVVVAGFSANANSSGNTVASVSPNADLNVGSLSVKANTPARNLSSTDLAAVVGGIGVSVVEANINITGNVEAFVGANSTISTPNGGFVTITATSNAAGTTTNTGGAGGLVAVSVFGANTLIGTPTAHALTTAYIDGGSTIGTGKLTITATSTSSVNSTLTSVGVAVVSVATATGQSSINSDTTAYLGTRTGGTDAQTIANTAGDASITATATQNAMVNVNVGGGGVITGGGANSTSQTFGNTLAYIGDDTVLNTTGSVSVLATVVGAEASTTLLTGTGGGIAVSNSDADAESTPVVTASIGNNSEVTASNNLSVLATGLGDATSGAQSDSGGILDVAVAYATATFTPTISATVGTGDHLAATQNLTVNATLDNAPEVTPPSDLIEPNGGDTTAVDVNADTADFAYPLTTGQTVVYNPDTSTDVIGGLTANRSYNVIVTDPTRKIQFGNLFDASQINPLTDVITFSIPDNFEAGDAVVLNAEGGLSIIDPYQTTLSPGNPLYVSPSEVFYVRPVYTDPNNADSIDPYSIRLVTTHAEAVAPETSLLSSFNATGVNSSNNTINLPGNNFVDGQQVTYRAAASSTFLTEDVDSTEVPYTYTDKNGNTQTTTDVQRDANGNAIHTTNNDIFVLNHGFSTGDAVVYTATGTPIGGLVNGQTYFVIVIDANTIQLAQTYYQAVGLAADPGDNVPAVAVTPITLTPEGPGGGTQSLSRSLTGLTDGNAYFVENVSGSTFQLSQSRGGSPIAISDTTAVPVLESNGTVFRTDHPVTAEGNHLIGTLGIALVTGTGTQSIYIDLTSDNTTGPQQLLGTDGVPLSQLNPLTGNGTSAATASGGSGGGIDANAPTAIMTVTPTVEVTINAATITAGNNVDIEAISNSTSISSADAGSGGIITVGEAVAKTLMDSAPTTAVIGSNVIVFAGNNFTLNAGSDESVSATASSEGGGFISAKIARTTVHLTANTDATVDTGANITAGNLLSVTAHTQLYAHSNADAYSVGVGAGADADNTNSDPGVTVNAPAVTTIMPGVILTANAVDLFSQIDSVDVDAHAHATAYSPIFFGIATAFATANASVTAPAETLIDGGSTVITGYDGVDIFSQVGTVTVIRDDYDLAVALIPPQASYEKGSTTVTGSITAGGGATVVAGTRSASTPLAHPSGQPQLALYVRANDSTQWDANVQILAANPTLVVDSSGNIITETGLTATVNNNNVTVANIVNPGAGQVLFSNPAVGGIVNGSLGTFTFEETYQSVNISSAYGVLTLGSIQVYSPDYGTEPKVTIDSPTNLLEFNVANIYGPTGINISNSAIVTTGGSIQLTGTIDNPIGTTSLTAAGSIYATNFANGVGTIQTNRLILNAGQEIGGTTPGTQDRIPVNMVQSPGLPTFMSVTAGTDMYLGIQGIDRDPTLVTGFTTTSGTTPGYFNAGGLADIMLLGGVNETQVSTSVPAGIDVYETSRVLVPFEAPSPTSPATSPRTTLVTNHFRVSTGGSYTASVGVFGSGTTQIPITYDLGLVQAGTSINIYKATSTTVQVNINSETNILDDLSAGTVNANTNGSIYLEETFGNLRVGLIQSTDNDVQLVSDYGNILDLASNPAAVNVVGINITLSANSGEIGYLNTPLEMDSSDPRAGVVNANAAFNIYLTEIDTGQQDDVYNSMNIGQIESYSGNVYLQVQYGAFLNARAQTTPNVIGNIISLTSDSSNPSINSAGAPGNDLMIDSSFTGEGGLLVNADGYIGITQTVNELYVLGVNSIDHDSFPYGSITTRDDATDRNDIIVTGPVNVSNLTFNAGDDFTQQAGAPIYAYYNGNITINVDLPATDADPGLGATLEIAGVITAGTLDLTSGNDYDIFDIRPQVLTTSALITVHGGEPSYPTYPGDTLVVTPGTAATNNVIDITQGRGQVTFSDGSTTIDYYSIEQITLTNAPPPEVVNVYANSTAWSPTFRDYVDNGFTDPAALGYPIPQGTLQLETLPWVNIDQLKIQFNQDVGASLTLGDFTITADPSWTALGVPVGTLPTITGFTYDSSTDTVTLQMSKDFSAAVVDLSINAAGVYNSNGTDLDGEWVNGVTTGHSGDGVEGGNFSFQMFILPGDSEDDSNEGGTRSVNSNDSQVVRDDQNSLVLSSTGPIGDYDIRADLDGSGYINTNDSQYERDQQSAIIYRVQTVANTPQVLTLGTSADLIRLDPDGSHVDIYSNLAGTGSPLESMLLSDISSIASIGDSASLTIDFSNGDPIPAGGLNVSGTALTLLGTTGNDSFTIGASTILVGSTGKFSGATINYSGLSTIDINGGSGDDVITQTAQPSGTTRVSISPTINDTLNIDAGQFTFPAPAVAAGVTEITLGTLNIGSGALVSLAPPNGQANRAVLILGAFSDAAAGKLDISSNDLILLGGGAAGLAAVSGELTTGFNANGGYWNGAGGIVSSAAATDSSHLTTLGVLLNSGENGMPIYGAGTAFGLFDGYNVGSSAVLVKFTYYGDTNLDGHVDGSDYTEIDNGFINHLAGWQNGDLNYDGKIDGSDYTLMDNAFNNQSVSFASQIAPAVAVAKPASVVATVSTKSFTIKTKGDGTAAWQATGLFQATTPISLPQIAGTSIEDSLQHKDVIDQLGTAE